MIRGVLLGVLAALMVLVTAASFLVARGAPMPRQSQICVACQAGTPPSCPVVQPTGAVECRIRYDTDLQSWVCSEVGSCPH